MKEFKAFAFEKGVLKPVIRSLRELKSDEVLIQNHAFSLNPVDFKVIKEGKIAGVDGMGVCVAGGELGKRFAYHSYLGDDGSFAEFSIVKRKALVPLKDELSNALAAALPCAGWTALMSLDKLPNLCGRRVLVSGGGMVAKILISLCLLEGCEVYALCHPSHHKTLKEWGVKECFEQYFDIDELFAIFDTAARAQNLLDKLAYNSHMVAILGRIEQNHTKPFSTCVSLHEVALGAIYEKGTQKDFQRLRQNALRLYDLALENKILLPRFEKFDFNELPKALNELKNGARGVKYLCEF
ncbi:hypothetical protein [Campylobacter sp. VTCC 70190]|uniref:hypothetical protein n=1 Tax=Campylobacter sp. VTCC 70190 TaxID=3392118 RepID=UPI00398ED37C